MDDSRGHEVDDTSRPHDVGFFTIADDEHYLGLVWFDLPKQTDWRVATSAASHCMAAR